MGLDTLLSLISDYSSKDKELIIKAFEFARSAHNGVVRKSGEPYIIHPLNVAIIAAKLHADADTIAACLLHDTIEDVPGITISLLKEQFNETVAFLVDGVTKIDKILYNNNRTLAELASHKKFIELMCIDIRILIIKLADRLHNMQTLQFHKKEKQIEISNETLSYYVPLAELIGAYNIKLELEDLCFYYLHLDEYKEMIRIEREMLKDNRSLLDEVLCGISQILNSSDVAFDVKLRIKNYYGVFKRLKTCGEPFNIHDYFQMKFILNDIGECYKLRDNVKKIYRPLDDKSKDYIISPKTNMYRALHTSVNICDNHLVQFQICTPHMDAVNSFGITAHWQQRMEENPALEMQHDFYGLQIFQVIQELISSKTDIEEFDSAFKTNVLGEKVYVQTPSRDVIELPSGSTPIDFAYRIHTDLGDFFVMAKVNGVEVKPDYILKDKDVVEIIYTQNKTPNESELIRWARTEHAKHCIKGIKKREIKRTQ